MGICRHRDSRGVAAPDADCAISAGSGGHAIFREEIPGSADAGTDCKVHDSGVSGRAVWTKNAATTIASWPPCAGGCCCVDCRGYSGLPRHSRKQEQKRRKELNILGADGLPGRSAPMNAYGPHQFWNSVPAFENRIGLDGLRRIRMELIHGWTCPVIRVPHYSYLSATIGSTRIARRAGM